MSDLLKNDILEQIESLKNDQECLIEGNYNYTRGMISGFFLCGIYSEIEYKEHSSNLREIRDQRRAEIKLKQFHPRIPAHNSQRSNNHERH